jgi:hypothetical protein
MILNKIKTIQVGGFSDFCHKFKIKTDKIAGDDGCDEELIEEELNKIKNQDWIVVYFEDSNVGYFELYLINQR